VLPGALFATAFWVIATSAFGWYVRHIADYRLIYGSLAAVIIFLVWAYVLSVIALLGCEFNAQRELALETLSEQRSPMSQPEDDAS
jgi:membrane protein